MNYLERKIKQVNSVVRFIEDPCSAPWTVYLHCALVPLGTLSLALLAFGFDDIVRGYFRPRGIYSHSRTGRRRGRGRQTYARRRGIPEIGEMVGKRLPGAEWVRARGVSAGVRAMWLVDGALQRVMFWWMIADVVSDFAYYWTTAVAETRECQLDRLIGGVCCQVQTTGSHRETLLSLSCSAFEKQWGEVDIVGGGYTYNSPLGTTAASVTVEVWVDEPWRVFTGFDMWIAYPSNPWIPLGPVTKGIQQPDGSWTGACDADIQGPGITHAYFVGHGRNCFITGGFLMGWAYKR